MNSIIDDLQCDPWPVEAGNRPARCVGSAMATAVAMLEAACGQTARGSRIVTFIGGPATYGPGLIVS